MRRTPPNCRTVLSAQKNDGAFRFFRFLRSMRLSADNTSAPPDARSAKKRLRRKGEAAQSKAAQNSAPHSHPSYPDDSLAAPVTKSPSGE
jgi:hypothetical protein